LALLATLRHRVPRFSLALVVALAALTVSHALPGYADFKDDEKTAGQLRKDNEEDAVALMLPYARQGNRKAQSLLASVYGNPKSKLYDPDKASYWQRLASEEGEPVPATSAAESTGSNQRAYLRETELACERTKIRVTTFCDALDDTRVRNARCYLQKIDFYEADSGKFLNDELFFYPEYRIDRSLATEMYCMKGDKTSAIIITSTNFGSTHDCYQCEWQDLFDLGGKHLASTAKFKDLNVRATSQNQVRTQATAAKVYATYNGWWKRLGLQETAVGETKILFEPANHEVRN
jgi:hypothetical protein